MNRELRPGVHDFLGFCATRFQRVVLFTSVSRHHAEDVVAELWLNDLDHEFYRTNEEEDLAALRAGYVRMHPDQFNLEALEPCFADLWNCPLNRRSGS
jgi:hypothetical protein